MNARDRISAYLKSVGFEGRRLNFNRHPGGRLIHAVYLQKDRRGEQFTAEVGVYSIDFHDVEEGDSRAEYEGPRFVEVAACDIRQRLGSLGPGKRDQWWPLEGNPGGVATEVIGLLEHHGIPFLDRFVTGDALINHFGDQGRLPGMTEGRSALVVATLLVRSGQPD